MSSELAPLFLDTILSGFAARCPRIHLEIGLTDRHVDIIREDYDVAFRVGAVENGDLIIRRLADFEMIMVGSPDFANNHGLPGTIKEAARLPFARYMGNGYPNDVKLDDGTHFVPQGRVDCDSGQALKAAARHGLGAAVVMRCVVKDDLEKELWSKFRKCYHFRLCRFTLCMPISAWFPCVCAFFAIWSKAEQNHWLHREAIFRFLHQTSLGLMSHSFPNSAN